MLTITQLPNKKLSIKADYFYRDRIKKIPTAQFDFDTKQWIIEDFMLGTLEAESHGELVYKTPRWVILNQPMTDMSAMYKITNTSIKAPTLKLKPYPNEKGILTASPDALRRLPSVFRRVDHLRRPSVLLMMEIPGRRLVPVMVLRLRWRRLRTSLSPARATGG